ncbi:MAG TPA: hypothetical protein ENG35_04995 [Desulfobacteraceae bacterium]|nr:hypothetical protein [Desulfobacteraceae bacterium]
MDISKKTAAAISAVISHIKTDEDIVAHAVAAPLQQQALPAVYAPVPVKLWGLNGRQAQMQMRSMMQVKAFHGWKVR